MSQSRPRDRTKQRVRAGQRERSRRGLAPQRASGSRRGPGAASSAWRAREFVPGRSLTTADAYPFLCTSCHTAGTLCGRSECALGEFSVEGTHAACPTRSLQVGFRFRLHPLSRCEREREQRGGFPDHLGGKPGSRIVHEEMCSLQANTPDFAAWLSGLLKGGWGVTHHHPTPLNKSPPREAPKGHRRE